MDVPHRLRVLIPMYPSTPLTPVFLSRESEYGLEGLAVLARRPQGTVMLLQDIARARHLPAGFLARIFQKLRRHNLVASHRGAVRGYALTRSAREITLLGILEAIEGPHLLDRCIFRSRGCGEQGPCRLHRQWVPMAATLRRSLARTTLAEVASRAPRARATGARPPGRRAREVLAGAR